MAPSRRTDHIQNALAQFIRPSIPSHHLYVTHLLSLLPERHDKLNAGSNQTANNCCKNGLESCGPPAAHNVPPPVMAWDDLWGISTILLLRLPGLWLFAKNWLLQHRGLLAVLISRARVAPALLLHP
jgi:hypothetical protein